MRDLRRAHEACLVEACLVIVGVAILAGGPLAGVAAAAPSEDGVAPPAPPAATGAEPSASPPAVSDSEAPPPPPRRVAPRIHVPPPEEEELAPWLRHPGSGVMFDFGAFGGGADLAMAQLSDGTMETLSAGGGVFLSVGGLVTPFWIGDAVGFGLGGYVGVKYQSIGGSNGHLTLTRFPLGVGAHSLIRLSERWFLFLRGGIQKELGVSLSGDGDVTGSQDLNTSLGVLGEGGFYYVSHAADNHMAMLIAFRYTTGQDSANGTTVESNSAGVVLGVHYNL